MNRIVKGAASLAILLASSALSACVMETGTGDDGHQQNTSAETSAGPGSEVGGQASGPGGASRVQLGATGLSQPPQVRGLNPGGSNQGGTGEDPQPSPWTGTDNMGQANVSSPIDRQQMGQAVEHK